MAYATKYRINLQYIKKMPPHTVIPVNIEMRSSNNNVTYSLDRYYADNKYKFDVGNQPRVYPPMSDYINIDYPTLYTILKNNHSKIINIPFEDSILSFNYYVFQNHPYIHFELMDVNDELYLDQDICGSNEDTFKTGMDKILTCTKRCSRCLSFGHWTERQELNHVCDSCYLSRVVTYKHINDSCIICMEVLDGKNMYVTPCGHMYHNACFSKIRKQRGHIKCPLCRQDIPSVFFENHLQGASIEEMNTSTFEVTNGHDDDDSEDDDDTYEEDAPHPSGMI